MDAERHERFAGLGGSRLGVGHVLGVQLQLLGLKVSGLGSKKQSLKQVWGVKVECFGYLTSKA